MNTIASQLHRDPRITQGKKLLLEALLEYKNSITEVRPGIGSLQQSYQDLLHHYEKMRGNPLFYPYLGSGIGNGALVELADGSVKYDLITGIGVHFFGHNHPLMFEATLDGSLSNTLMQGNLQQNSDSVLVTEKLIQLSGMDHCILTTSGTMANENALKMIFQKKCPAQRLIAFDRTFSGRSLVLSQITDKASFRQNLPLSVFVDYIPFYDPKEPEQSTARSLNALKKLLKRYPKQHACMLFELIQGEGGVYPGSREFFLPLMRLLKEEDIAIFVDEIQTFGRTESLLAYDHFELREFVDVTTIGKMTQLCATLFKKTLNPSPGLIGQTFTSSTACIRACIALLDHLVQGNYYGSQGKIAQLFHTFEEKLKQLSQKYPQAISGPFGIGAMIAFTPYGGDHHKTIRLAKQLFEAGVISYIAGENPTRLRFLLPVPVITFKDIDKIVEIIEKVIQKT